MSNYRKTPVPSNKMNTNEANLEEILEESIHTPTNEYLSSPNKNSSSVSVIPTAPRIINVSNRNYDILGSGGYGQVISPALPNMKNGFIVEYPGNVTKFFYDKDDKNAVLKLANKLPELMGENKGHKVYNYSYPYKYVDLPAYLKDELSPKVRSGNLFAVRMPNLGVSMDRLSRVYIDLREVPIINILEQVVKLLSQTAHLDGKKYIHGDIRDTNVTINPKDGTMTLIDFDWLKPYEEFAKEYTFNFYNNPPELLLIPDADTILPKLKDNSPLSFDNIQKLIAGETAKNYINYALMQIDQYSFLEQDYRIYVRQILTGVASSLDYLINLYKNNDISVLKRALLVNSLPTFDNFGLSFVLIELFRLCYPSSYEEDTNEELFKSLKKRTKNRNVPYTDKELHLYTVALMDFMKLFKSMASLTMTDRPKPQDAYNQAQKILMNAQNKLNNSATNKINTTASVQKANNVKVNNVNRKTRKSRAGRSNTRRNRKF